MMFRDHGRAERGRRSCSTQSHGSLDRQAFTQLWVDDVSVTLVVDHGTSTVQSAPWTSPSAGELLSEASPDHDVDDAVDFDRARGTILGRLVAKPRVRAGFGQHRRPHRVR
jgi:hypothetical protein